MIVLSKEQHEAFRDYIRKGGNYIGVHSAACASYSSSDYGKLVGGTSN
jgi:type 1 glutamine amidotransferase